MNNNLTNPIYYLEHFDDQQEQINVGSFIHYLVSDYRFGSLELVGTFLEN